MMKGCTVHSGSMNFSSACTLGQLPLDVPYVMDMFT